MFMKHNNTQNPKSLQDSVVSADLSTARRVRQDDPGQIVLGVDTRTGRENSYEGPRGTYLGFLQDKDKNIG